MGPPGSPLRPRPRPPRLTARCRPAPRPQARTLHRARGAGYPDHREGPWPEPSPTGAPPLTTVVYFHGFASGPQGPSPKTDLIRDLGYAVALIATDGDYRPAGYRAAFARLGLDPAAPVVLMGTSLGGFWARRLGQELGRPWLALNPAIQPSVTLRRYLGPNTRFDTGGAFVWTAADCEAYVAEEHFPLRPDVPGLLICAADDEVLDYRVARDAAATAQVLVLPGGGHQLHNTGDYGEAVGAFLAAVTDRPCRGDT